MSFRETINGTTFADRVLLVVIILLSLAGFVSLREVLSGATEVNVTVQGKTMYKFPLDADRSVKVEGDHGYLTVEIKDRKVRVTEASCPNRVCEQQGWITGGAIICVPNRITVTVGGPEKGDGRRLDAISG